MSKLEDLLGEHTAEKQYEVLCDLADRLCKRMQESHASEAEKRGMGSALSFVQGYVNGFARIQGLDDGTEDED
jgi:hypothetical protein